MKKNKKGFTLIELLAVVIILIIIILIAMNAIRRNVDKTLDNTIMANGGAYVKAVNNFIEVESIGNTIYDDASFTVSQLEQAGVNVSGTKPDSGLVIISNRRVAAACLEYDNYHVSYTKGQMASPEKGTCGEGAIAFEFDYTGKEEVFSAPTAGNYKIEVWGAEGGKAVSYEGSETLYGGTGGYSVGYLYLNAGDKLYINVGGKGIDDYYTGTGDIIAPGGYNGGGGANGSSGDSDLYRVSTGGGGGATSVAFTSGLLSNLSHNVPNIVMVAGGGGGSSSHRYNNSSNYWRGTGGNGGGYTSTTGTSFGRSTSPTSATQLFAGCGYNDNSSSGCGAFGQGQVNTASGGGGGGLYGGGASVHSSTSGGSGYIGYYRLYNARMYCNNCTESTYRAYNTKAVTCNESKPTEKCAKKGNGYAKISLQNTSSEPQSDIKYLYSFGNEFTDVTGGWNLYNGQANGRSEKLEGSMRIYCSSKSSSHSSTNPAHAIDVTGYTKLNVLYQIVSYQNANDYGKLSISVNGSGGVVNSYQVGTYTATRDLTSNSLELSLYNYDADIRIIQVWLSN